MTTQTPGYWLRKAFLALAVTAAAGFVLVLAVVAQVLRVVWR